MPGNIWEGPRTIALLRVLNVCVYTHTFLAQPSVYLHALVLRQYVHIVLHKALQKEKDIRAQPDKADWTGPQHMDANA